VFLLDEERCNVREGILNERPGAAALSQERPIHGDEQERAIQDIKEQADCTLTGDGASDAQP